MNVKSIPNEMPLDYTWQQRLFESAALPLVLRDHTRGIYLPSGTLDSAKVANVEFKDHVVLAATTGVSNQVHVVAHLGTAETRTSVQGDLFDPPVGVRDCNSIILQVTRESITSVSASSENFIWFSMKDRHAYEQIGQWLSEFLKLTFEQAKQLAGFKTRADAHEFEAEFSHFLDIILPGRVENLLAFRLLCEATKVVAEENTKRAAKGEQTSNSAEWSNIIIHAPKNLAEWLAPFGENLGERNIPMISGTIGSDSLKTAAEQVLYAANGRGDLSQAIIDFLKLDGPKNS
jgi:hypothetical protein